MSIKNTCVRVKLSLGKQSAYITDKNITASVESNFATHGRGKWTKRMFKDCVPFNKLQSSSTAISQMFNKETLPWDDAWRVTKAANVMELAKKIEAANNRLKDDLTKFKANYHNYVAEDIAASKGMMKQDDYPDINEIEEKFYVKFKISPMPGAEDFRITEGLEQEEVDQLIEKAKADEREMLNRALQEPRQRLYKVVQHMKDRLTEYQGKEGDRLHKSVIENVRDCIETLRKLNINDDADLDNIMDELESSVLEDANIDRLKVIENERKETVSKIDTIMDKMSFFGGK